MDRTRCDAPLNDRTITGRHCSGEQNFTDWLQHAVPVVKFTVESCREPLQEVLRQSELAQ
jgi:hypothetical protein